MKKKITTHVICFMLGCIIGILLHYGYQSRQNNILKNKTIVKTIQGKPGTIKHEKIKNNKENIEITTISKGKGKIKTTIKKESFCPKIYKNSLSLVVYGGIQDLKPVISYGIEYRRQVFSRFHILTGFKVDTNTNMINGFQAFLGVGLNF